MLSPVKQGTLLGGLGRRLWGQVETRSLPGVWWDVIHRDPGQIPGKRVDSIYNNSETLLPHSIHTGLLWCSEKGWLQKARKSKDSGAGLSFSDGLRGYRRNCGVSSRSGRTLHEEEHAVLTSNLSHRLEHTPHTWCIERVANEARSWWFPEKGFWALPGSLGHPKGWRTGLGKWQDSRRKICSETTQKCLQTALYVSCMSKWDRKKTEKETEFERVKEKLACPGSTWAEEQTKTRISYQGPWEGLSLRGFLYPDSPRHMPVLTPSSWAPGKPPEIQVQCYKESKDLSKLVRLHIHHEKGSVDFIENWGSFFSCTPEFVDYVREPGHPGNGHSSAQDWGFKLAPPAMTKVYLLWALLTPLFLLSPILAETLY